MKVIILEDEPLAVTKIKKVIEDHFNTVEIIGYAQSIQEGRVLLEGNKPDILLCDIHLADGLSFELLKEFPLPCPTIFITAYDEYALQSFEHNCLDYILKPLDEQKLVNALEKAQKAHERKQTNLISPELVEELLRKHQLKSYKKRFICKMGNKVVFKSADEIACFFVEDKVTFIQEATSGKKYIISHNLEELEYQFLDPEKFYRINRSAIINLDHLVEMKKYNNGRLKLMTKPSEQLDLIVARDRVSDFKTWLNQ